MYAASQGALGVECRRDDTRVVRMLNELSDESTVLRCVAERCFLARLEAGCSAPVGVHSTLHADSDAIQLNGVVLNVDGTQRIEDTCRLSFSDDANPDNDATTWKVELEFSFIVDMRIDERRLRVAARCGRLLADKLVERGALLLVQNARYQK